LNSLRRLQGIDWNDLREIARAIGVLESMTNGAFASDGRTEMLKKSKSQIITETKRDLPPIHPGEVLLEDFLKPLGITQYRLAKSIKVPQRRIGEIVAGRRSLSADTALRLARFFGTDAQSWLNLQAHYDLEMAREKVGDLLEIEITPKKQVA
jgi:antitoxin HigA-1